MALQVPSEVWGQVFSLLPLPSLGAAACVCRRFRTITADDAFKTRLLRDGLSKLALAGPLAPLDLTSRSDDAWRPPQPGSLDQFLRACIHQPSLGVQDVIARTWLFFVNTTMNEFLLLHYAHASSPDHRALLMTLTCRLGLVNPLDLFRGHFSLMHILLSVGARQSPDAAALLQMSSKMRHLLRLEATHFSTTEMPEPGRDRFVALILSSTPPKHIAEQLTIRTWEAYAVLAPSHLCTRDRAKDGVFLYMSNEIGTLNLICSYALLSQIEDKARKVVLERLIQILTELVALRNMQLAMGLYQTLNNRWFAGRRVLPCHNKTYLKLMAAAHETFSPTRNYKAYRDLLAESANRPHIPALTLPRVDLRFLYDTQHMTVAEGYNYKRLEMASTIVRDALAPQRLSYTLAADGALLRVLDGGFSCTHAIKNKELDALYDKLPAPP